MHFPRYIGAGSGKFLCEQSGMAEGGIKVPFSFHWCLVKKLRFDGTLQGFWGRRGLNTSLGVATPKRLGHNECMTRVIPIIEVSKKRLILD